MSSSKKRDSIEGNATGKADKLTLGHDNSIYRKRESNGKWISCPSDDKDTTKTIDSLVELLNAKFGGGYVGASTLKNVMLMADETASGVSGCSTDSSVRLIKEIENRYNTDLFNRQNLAFFTGENIIQIPLSKLNEAISGNLINPETYYFNNAVLSKKELEEKWIIKLKNSWLKNKVK